MSIIKRTIFVAATVICCLSNEMPARAFGTVSCSGPNSGFIKAGNQVVCLRQLTPEELEAARNAARAKADAKRRKKALAAAQQRKRQAARHMDIAADNILQPGGRQAYRDALDNYTDAAVRLNQMTR